MRATPWLATMTGRPHEHPRVFSWWLCAFVATFMLVCAPVQAATDTAADKKAAAPTDSYDDLFAKYLQSARDLQQREGRRIDWMVGLASDPRARSVNDLVTVRVIENITASGTADSAVNKKSSAAAGVPTLFGLEKALPSQITPSSLAAASAATDFKGGGTTNRAGQLTAVMTTRVAEVLPNGDLVLEGVREIEINGDRQIIVLSGVVRPYDIMRDNSVFSTQVGQLRVRYFGKGLMKDSLQPGWLIRVLNKIF